MESFLILRENEGFESRKQDRNDLDETGLEESVVNRLPRGIPPDPHIKQSAPSWCILFYMRSIEGSNLPEVRRHRGAVRGDSAESTEDFESQALQLRNSLRLYSFKVYL